MTRGRQNRTSRTARHTCGERAGSRFPPAPVPRSSPGAPARHLTSSDLTSSDPGPVGSGPSMLGRRASACVRQLVRCCMTNLDTQQPRAGYDSVYADTFGKAVQALCVSAVDACVQMAETSAPTRGPVSGTLNRYWERSPACLASSPQFSSSDTCASVTAFCFPAAAAVCGGPSGGRPPPGDRRCEAPRLPRWEDTASGCRAAGSSRAAADDGGLSPAAPLAASRGGRVVCRSCTAAGVDKSDTSRLWAMATCREQVGAAVPGTDELGATMTATPRVALSVGKRRLDFQVCMSHAAPATN